MNKKLTNVKEYKTPKFRIIMVEILGWSFIFLFLAGIWIDSLRVKLISTSLFFLLLAILITIVDSEEEKKFENKKGEQK